MHNNKKSITVVVLVATIITLSIFSVSKITTTTAMGQTSNMKSTVVSDSATILLDG